MIKSLSARKMAGQRLMLGFEGTEFNEDIRHLIKDLKTGGLILFKYNIESPAQVRKLCRQCQDYAKECGLPELFIAVDQEGGVVARLKDGFTQFKGNPSIHTRKEAADFARITANELNDVGINMNLAPVLDIAPSGLDSIMKERAFSGDAQTVSKLGLEVIKIFQKNGIMAVAKHFPGVGRTTIDSHFHLPVLDDTIESLHASDLIPFKEAIAQQVSGVMLSHISYPQLDARWQASLSPEIAGTLLRDQCGYEGLVLTDDLDMKAIGHDMPTCIQQILSARIDLALICHKGPNIDIAANEINRLINENERLYELATESVGRILKAKKEYLTS